MCACPLPALAPPRAHGPNPHLSTDIEKAPAALQQLVADADTGRREPAGLAGKLIRAHITSTFSLLTPSKAMGYTEMRVFGVLLRTMSSFFEHVEPDQG